MSLYTRVIELERRGPPGSDGTRGASGAQGPPGMDGQDGSDGADGTPGTPGASGGTGATGATGPAGATGPIGPPGLDGIDGADGDPGLPGPAGSNGSAGEPGATGSAGATGPAGPPGLDGLDGLDGSDGLPGPAGPAGSSGSDGCRGLVSQTLFVDHSTAVATPDQTGEFCFPFATIQQALDATNETDSWTVLCAPGIYDEGLVPPARCHVRVVPWGDETERNGGVVSRANTAMLFLGPPDGSSPQYIAWTSDGPAPDQTPFFGFQGFVSGGIAVLDDGDATAENILFVWGFVGAEVDCSSHGTGSVELRFEGANVQGPVTVPETGIVSIARNAFFGDTFSVVRLELAQDSYFSAGIDCSAAAGPTFANLKNCVVLGAVTDCESFWLDGATEYDHRRNGTIAGSTVYIRADDPLETSAFVDNSIDPFTIDPSDAYRVVLADSSGGAFSIELPPAPIKDDEFKVKDRVGAAGANVVTVDGNGNTIDGAATVAIDENWGSVWVKFNGIEWNNLSCCASASAATMGPAGPPGPPGLDGLDGVDGVDGAPGAAGATGSSGAAGANGATGPSGPPGLDGIDGDDGLPGPAGATGATGAAGSNGAPGATGATGPAGPPGLDGLDGIDGIDGLPGATGAAGANGAAGATGGTGAAGPPGLDGLDGADGIDGLPGPAGAAGGTGAQGAAGIAGPPGPPGLDGLDGSDGADGAPGAAGATGSGGAAGAAGKAGPQGPPGLDGLDGADGLDGLPGPAGPSGGTGGTGPAGSVGPAGPPGLDGLDGADGLDGLPGPAGAQGATGAPGAPGSGSSATTIEVDFGVVPKSQGNFGIGDAAITSAKKVLMWQAPGPYTGKGSQYDEAQMQPVQIIAVIPFTGTASVYWQCPPIIGDIPQGLSGGDGGRANTTVAPAGQSRQHDPILNRRVGKVRGNIKFSYMVLT